MKQCSQCLMTFSDNLGHVQQKKHAEITQCAEKCGVTFAHCGGGALWSDRQAKTMVLSDDNNIMVDVDAPLTLGQMADLLLSPVLP